MIVDHIQLAMPPSSGEVARSYFVSVLEMEEDTKPEPLRSIGGYWFRKDGVILYLGVEDGFIAQKKAHPVFIVSDLRGLTSKIVEAGYPLIWNSALPDRSRFYTNDPFGNRIEFIEEGDGFSQNRNRQFIR